MPVFFKLGFDVFVRFSFVCHYTVQIRKCVVLLYIISFYIVAYCSLLSSVYLFLGLSSLLPLSIGWISSAFVCLYVTVGRCHVQSPGKPIV